MGSSTTKQSLYSEFRLKKTCLVRALLAHLRKKGLILYACVNPLMQTRAIGKALLSRSAADYSIAIEVNAEAVFSSEIVS